MNNGEIFFFGLRNYLKKTSKRETWWFFGSYGHNVCEKLGTVPPQAKFKNYIRDLECK
jgi:hypothetical protein